jgi:acetyl-CoA decarbonylase/synthase complex subunit epsilon
MSAEPWQRAMMGGTKRAKLLSSTDDALSVLKKAKRPLFVVGHKSLEGEEEKEKPISYIIRFSRASNMPVLATAHMILEFNNRDFTPSGSMPAVDIVNRLRDNSWLGLDGKGPYDLVIIIGLPYDMEWLLFAGLKNSTKDLVRVSLDRFYQPHATWSFPNMSLKKWQETMEAMIKQLEGE